MDKDELRNYIKGLRNSMPAVEKSKYDEIIYKKVISSEYYKRAKVLFIYVSFEKEVDTHRIINYSIANNKIVCVPKVINVSEGMKAVRISSMNELKKGHFGVLEPESFLNEVKPDEIDLIIIPGLAFDKSHGRIGYGRGYYDRFLKSSKKDAAKVGLGYHFQLISKVPMGDKDEPVDNIITD